MNASTCLCYSARFTPFLLPDETISEKMSISTDAVSPIAAAIRFLRDSCARVLAISLILLTPCIWHRRVAAGDLASHVYNAWLAQLIEKGQAPGLYLAKRWNNVLVDLALLHAGNWFGLAAAG